ncbi:MAG: Na+/H+ antiporter subunit E [Lachnospiraceae bacterium]|nr:Na+/H+ antiporter subunit E [Lachnospiraceae bacterium]
MYFLFYVLWIVFNGQLTWEIAVIGLFVAGLIYAFLCKFMGWSLKKDLRIIKYTIFMVGYLFVLLWEILKANMATIRLVFTEKYEREPVLVTFKTNIKSPVLRVLLANSITLTPGTITVSLQDNEYTVHALDKELADGIEDSVFVHLLEKAERLGRENG